MSAAATGGVRDAEQLVVTATAALARHDEDATEPALAAYVADHPRDARMRHWHALLLRELDRRDEAVATLQVARRLAPEDAGIAHALAHVSLEAGLPATRAFLEAIQLAPAKGEIRLGLASARFAEGAGGQALDELRAMLAANAGWLEGHRQFAQLAAMLGRSAEALSTIELSLQAYPAAGDLYLTGIDLLLDAERCAEALALIERAVAQFGEAEPLLMKKAAALDELGRFGEAADLFERVGPATDQAHAIRRIRHLLRQGDAQTASREIEPWLTQEADSEMWPYATLAWRLTGDARAEWLEGLPGTYTVIDMPSNEIDVGPLAECLRALHARSGRFLNQSVRGGTQTDGPLLARSEPVVAQTREALRAQIATFAEGLADADQTHPQRRWKQTARPRFAGSWSVRLTDSGFHESHHHPQGWLSAVFYVAVPEGLDGQEGHLILGGSPNNLGPALGPRATIEPKPGRLVIFPSFMWHATLPFSNGERLTLAFDIARF